MTTEHAVRAAVKKAEGVFDGADRWILVCDGNARVACHIRVAGPGMLASSPTWFLGSLIMGAVSPRTLAPYSWLERSRYRSIRK